MLQVFKSLPVVRVIHRRDELPQSARTFARHMITLGWEERLRSRCRLRSDSGTEFGIALPRGTVLRGGDCLVLDEHRLVVEVVEREEPVLVVRPASAGEWGLFGYYIGNSHQPVMLTDQEIVCPDVPGMAQVLEQHGIAFSAASRPFTPVRMLGDYLSGHSHVVG